jgi:hypothetical protein
VKYVVSGHWPRALHEGNGTGKIWIDETASAPQRTALEEILKGQHGAMP